MATGWNSKAINIYYFRDTSYARSYVTKELNELSNGQVTDLVGLKCTLFVHVFVATEGRAARIHKKLSHQIISL
jgi:hypothetical protein